MDKLLEAIEITSRAPEPEKSSVPMEIEIATEPNGEVEIAVPPAQTRLNISSPGPDYVEIEKSEYPFGCQFAKIQTDYIISQINGKNTLGIQRDPENDNHIKVVFYNRDDIEKSCILDIIGTPSSPYNIAEDSVNIIPENYDNCRPFLGFLDKKFGRVNIG